MVELSQKTRELVAHLFPSNAHDHIVEVLRSNCADNLPLVNNPDPDRLERIRFAVLRASEGDGARLAEMVSLAQQDWRDVLVAAGFAHSVDEHERWAQRVLGQD